MSTTTEYIPVHLPEDKVKELVEKMDFEIAPTKDMIFPSYVMAVLTPIIKAYNKQVLTRSPEEIAARQLFREKLAKEIAERYEQGLCLECGQPLHVTEAGRGFRVIG